MENQTLLHMKVVSLVEFLFCKIQPWIISQIDRWILAENIFPLKIKLFTIQWLQSEKQTALLAGRNPKLTTAADKNMYAGVALSYRTQWFENKYQKLKASVHNSVVREMGKKVILLTSEHKIINSRARHASLSNDITHQNTWFQWSPLKSLGNLTLHYIHLHYTFHSRIKNFSACCSTSCGIKLAPSQASRLRWACLLEIKTWECSDDIIKLRQKYCKLLRVL